MSGAGRGWELLVGTASVLVAALLAVDVAYFVHGSLELFPTEEQQEKIRLGTGCLGIVLLVLEAALVVLWVRLRRSR